MGRMIFSCAIFRVAKIVRGSLEGQMVPEREPTSGSIQSCAVRHLWLSQESVRDFLPQLSCLSVLVDFCSARLLFSFSGCFHFFQCCQIGWLQEGGIQHPHLLANARRRARQRFHDYPNCLRLLLLLLLLLLLVPKQYEEVREGLSVSEGGSLC